MNKKIIFLGAKEIGYKCLEYLIKNKLNLEIELLGIGLNKKIEKEGEWKLSELAKNNNINTFYELDDLNQFPKVDLIISVQYHKILTKKNIQRAKLCINLHMAPLPEYRGCNQFSLAILHEKSYFGTTIHILDEGIDSGDILFEDRYEIKNDIWVDELIEITTEKSYNLYKENISHIIENNFRRIHQNLNSKSNYCNRKDIQKMKNIVLDNSDPVAKMLRATHIKGFPECTVKVGFKKFKLVEIDES